MEYAARRQPVQPSAGSPAALHTSTSLLSVCPSAERPPVGWQAAVTYALLCNHGPKYNIAVGVPTQDMQPVLLGDHLPEDKLVALLRCMPGGKI